MKVYEYTVCVLTISHKFSIWHSDAIGIKNGQKLKKMLGSINQLEK